MTVVAPLLVVLQGQLVKQEILHKDGPAIQ